MLRKFVACVFGSVALVAFAASATPATAAPQRLSIQVMKGQAALTPEGTVLVTIRARCHQSLDAFEVNVGVRQPPVFGSVLMLGTEFPPCDGRWHRTTVIVAPETGVFVAGTATVEAFIAAFHPREGDLDATDAETVRLK
jgi:hypothetical protein